MQLSFIVVTYQRGELLKRCLESIYMQVGLPMPYEVIVIDNGGDAEVLQPDQAAVKLHVERPPENLGAVGGRNAGMELASGEYFVFLDDDAVWHDEGDVLKLISHLAANELCGAVAVKSLNSSGQIIPTEMPHPNKAYITTVSQPVEVPYFYAMGYAFRAEVYRRVGGYPPRFNIYMEEVDLSLRLVNAGYHIVYDPDVAVYHSKSKLGRSIQKGRYWQQNTLNKSRLAWRLLPWPYPLTIMLVWSAALFFKTGNLLSVLSVWQSLWKERDLLKKERKPIDASTVRYLHRVGVRLLY